MIEVRRSVVVAVDGPSGSGKSSVSREVARRAGLAYLDTGAMYRALTWRCLRDEVDVEDEAAVVGALQTLELDLSTDPELPHVAVSGNDVTLAVRSAEVTAAVSAVARHKPVRRELVRRQRAVIAESRRGCVAEGRDITTVVAPDADVRLLLTASPEARLARRAEQLHGSAGTEALRASYAGVVDRDRVDAAVTSFQVAADDEVVVIDSSLLALEETVERVLALVEQARSGDPGGPVRVTAGRSPAGTGR